MRPIVGLAVVSIALCTTASADEKEKLFSLEQVLEVAVRQAPELARATVSKQQAAGVAMISDGITDVNLTAGVSVSRTKAAGTPVDKSQQYDLGISKLLPIGTDIALNGSYSKTPPLAGEPMVGSSSRLTLSIDQPLLRGIGLAATLAPIRIATANKTAAELEQLQQMRDTVSAIVAAYWQLSLAWRNLEIRRDVLKSAEKQLGFTKSGIANDKLPKSELFAVEQAVAVRKQDVLAGELAVWDRSLALRELAGLELEDIDVLIQTKPMPTADAPDVDPSTAIAKAIANNAAVAAAESRTRGSRAGADGVATSNLPTLGLHLEGSVEGTGGSFSASADNLTGSPGYEATASLQLGYGIGNHGGRGEAMLARAELLRARTEERSLKLKVAAETVRRVQQIRALRTIVELGQRAIELAIANVEAEQRRFEAGRTTNNEVIRRQDELGEVRLRHASSVVELLVANAALASITGTILDDYSIAVR